MRPTALILVALLYIWPAPAALAQTPYPQQQAEALDYLGEHADFERFVPMPMRDGVRLNALILFPKDRPRDELPTVLFRSPYLIEPGEVNRFALYLKSFIANGYAAVIQNVRGRYFSEGTYAYLVGSEEDGYDSVDWIVNQPWSNAKVGTLGCSSTAEEQHRLNAAGHPGLAATAPFGSGAGIGRVGPYNEMGNFYRGGAIQTLWFSWYYGSGYRYRPLFPPDLSREEMIRLGRFWNLEPNIEPDPGIDSLIWTLPLNAVPERMLSPPSDLDEFANRHPNDPAWAATDFGGAEHAYHAPTLMVNSWYDVSMGPNVALYAHQAEHAATALARDNMFMVIAPTTHCTMGRVESEHTIVGERDMGDARLDYVGLVQDWFDHFLEGVDNGVTRRPKVLAYMMGANEWREHDAWPPPEMEAVAYYLASGGRANSALGDGHLVSAPPREGSDTFVYDPMRPVVSRGGSVCCFSAAFQGGSFDQSDIELRNDVLVYTSPPLETRLEVTGPVEVVLYLSSDAPDTDLTVKLLDVDPEGRAWNLDENIQRVRWREGWDAPVFMEPGNVYRVEVGPLVTSNAFRPGHRIRIEVSSSNFPRFERNLNTGGNNFDEAVGRTATNTVHHSATYPSRIVLPVLRR